MQSTIVRIVVRNTINPCEVEVVPRWSTNLFPPQDDGLGNEDEEESVE